MTTPAAASATGSASRAEALLASFAAAGYAAVQPSILQPAEPFLDLSGEDIRKSLYLTTDASGDELCLRPDLTIPVARDYLASARAGQPASFNFGPERLGAGYMNARAELDRRFKERIGSLPPATRVKVEKNLADLRHAADEISATLAENPSDPLLQELLMSTYQSELQLLANVSELPTAGSMRTDL